MKELRGVVRLSHCKFMRSPACGGGMEFTMVRGYQKRIVFLKNTGSPMFDEAYFILNDRYERCTSESDMVKEANRIIEENLSKEAREEKGVLGRIFTFLKRYALPFALGCVTTLIIGLFI